MYFTGLPEGSPPTTARMAGDRGMDGSGGEGNGRQVQEWSGVGRSRAAGQSDIANTVACPLQCALFIIEHRPTFPQTVPEVSPQKRHDRTNVICAADGNVSGDLVSALRTLVCGADSHTPRGQRQVEWGACRQLGLVSVLRGVLLLAEQLRLRLHRHLGVPGGRQTRILPRACPRAGRFPAAARHLRCRSHRLKPA